MFDKIKACWYIILGRGVIYNMKFKGCNKLDVNPQGKLGFICGKVEFNS